MEEFLDALEFYQQAVKDRDAHRDREGYASEFHLQQVYDSRRAVEEALNKLIDERIEKRLKES